MQMHNGTLTGEGSFNQGLKELFYKAGDANKRKLINAFPEFFGEEVPEFGIFKANKIKKEEAANKTFKYKGWLCEWKAAEGEYYLYTPDEVEQPKGFRVEEFECETKEMCKELINCY